MQQCLLLCAVVMPAIRSATTWLRRALTMEDQVQYQASPFVRGNAECDKCRVKGTAVPMHAMQAYRMEKRYSSTHS